MSSDNNTDKIKQILEESDDVSSREIAKKLGLERSQVNRILYSLKGKGDARRTKENPPRWSLVTGKRSVKAEVEKIFVLIDLGNFHKAPFADIDSSYPHVKMYGFADTYYNGVRPRNTQTASAQVKNAADMMLMDFMSQMWRENRGSKFVVCSSDKFFMYAPTLSKNYGCETVIAKTEEELRIHID